jgi:tetratricopeptide (TPR) repeat protein
MFRFSLDKYRPELARPVLIPVLSCALLLATVTVAQNRKPTPAQPGGQSAGALLGRADVLYKSDDITDAADTYYKQVVGKFPKSQEAGYAQYNRGAYWQRKYYIVKERYGKEDTSALVEAEGQYYDFVTKYAVQTNTVGLLSDAEFNLALVYLQKGKPDYAVGWLNRMLAEAVGKDRAIHIYKVVWSSNADDTVDRDVDANQLARVTIELINSGRSFNDVIAGLKRWAQGQGKY